jgi:hypothetical protein
MGWSTNIIFDAYKREKEYIHKTSMLQDDLYKSVINSEVSSLISTYK